jgi:DNA helicase-2/ATP-dependent DNA helicase PcrA
VNDCYKLLATICDGFSSFETVITQLETEISQLGEKLTTGKSFADYFYVLLATEPFTTFLDDVNKRQNLVIFSQLLETFQNYYHFQDGFSEKKEELIASLFNRFFCLLYEDGMNEYENPEQPFPKGHVLVMTIHQAKGLEFSVVAVGSLDKQVTEPEEIDNQLGSFYHRPQPEPEDDIPLFDFMRKYYVAFSRAVNVLVLMGNQRKRPSNRFNSILQGLPEWPDVQGDLSNIEVFKARAWLKPKPRYSYTGHIRMYETCPRQYQFYREYQFVPSRPADTFMGLLVHQTIEKIHRIALDKQVSTLTATKLRTLFEQTHYFLSLTNMPLPDEKDKEKAFEQVEHYFYNNQFEMYDVKNVEEQVAIMKGDYILTGKIDVVMERNGKREIWDLKTSRPPELDSISLENYERQLYMYAHALEQRDDITPERLVLYWTEEPLKKDAIMIFPYQRNQVDAAVKQFETIVSDIKDQKFAVVTPPHPNICKKCDLRSRCIREGVIEPLQPTC